MIVFAWLEFAVGCVGYMVAMTVASTYKGAGWNDSGWLAAAGLAALLAFMGLARLWDLGSFTP